MNSVRSNNKDVHHQVQKLKGLENLSLWQRLNSIDLLTITDIGH